MILIGLVGENGSGKETFANLLKEKFGTNAVTHIHTSDLLKETLTAWSVPLTRRNLQDMAIIMDHAYGKGTLSRAIKERITNAKTDFVILDGVRWQSDVDLIRSITPNKLVYITASVEHRYERIKTRKEKVGEDQASFEQFLKEEQIETELEIKNIGKGADITIVNDGSIEDLRREVEASTNKITCIL